MYSYQLKINVANVLIFLYCFYLIYIEISNYFIVVYIEEIPAVFHSDFDRIYELKVNL